MVSVTVRGEEVTAQPIPRSLSDGDLLVSVRDRDWTYIENVDTGATELYHRPSDPGQTADRSADPDEAAAAVLEDFGPLAAAHADRLVDDGGERAVDDDDLDARLEALGYK